MTIWTPEISGQGAKALRIADAIAADIAADRLRPGQKLPPQRDLAFHLKVSVGTVTRAYAEAERRGLVSAQVGSGTYVRDGNTALERFGISKGAEYDGIVDLSANLSQCDLRQAVLDQALEALRGLPGSSELMEYQPAPGMARHRAAGASWIGRAGIEADPARIVVCQGAQQALAIAFSALTEPGDVVLTECLTFPPVKLHADMFHFRLHGVEVDEFGLVPEALEAAIRATGARLLYAIPTFQNPTGGVMPEERRREIARIARAHDVGIVEDDVYATLLDPCPPPIARFAPERTWYITSVSKCLAPGLRVGYLLCPDDNLDPFFVRARALGWMTTPIGAEIATLWMEDGTADRLVDWHRREIAARAAIARSVLGPVLAGDCPHLWLDLPDPWRGSELAAETMRQGVRVAEGGAFAVGRNASNRHAVRISLNAARNRDELRSALEIVANCIDGQPTANSSIM